MHADARICKKDAAVWLEETNRDPRLTRRRVQTLEEIYRWGLGPNSEFTLVYSDLATEVASWIVVDPADINYTQLEELAKLKRQQTIDHAGWVFKSSDTG